MKIAYIGGFYPEIGGPFTSAKGLLSSLSSQGFGITVASALPPRYDRKRLGFMEALSFPVQYVREGIFRRMIPSYSTAWRQTLLALDRQVDVFHINGLFDHFSMLAPTLLSKPYVLSVRGSLMRDAFALGPVKRSKKSLYMVLMGKRILAKAAALHVTCEAEQEDLLNFMPDVKGKTVLVPNGLDAKSFGFNPDMKRFFSKFPMLRGRRYILFVGRIHPIKGLDILLEAFRRIPKEENLVLVLAGPDANTYSQGLKRKVSAYDLSKRIIFTGMLYGEDKVAALKGAEMFILPSYSENFGMAAVEAMAAGTPIILSSHVGICRDVSSCEAGLIVGLDPQEISAAIARLAGDKALAGKLSNNALKAVGERYEIRAVAAKMGQIYECVAKGKA